ncbi:MAG TPA: DUF3488 and transglutaminase-like domain-containing protein [Acidobacteriota bacterium]|nr:DUF3488 and transglutaminase-like domain-containing protein [Acidobacteriota bacterium]
MNAQQLFKASSYCLIGSGFAAIMVAGALGPVPITLFSAVFIAGWFADTAKIKQAVSVRLANTLAVAYMVFFAVDYLLLERPLITALLHFLLYATAIKLLTLTRDRDYVQLYFVSFVLLLTASILTVTLAFLFFLLVFLLSAVGTLLLFDMRRNNSIVRKRAEISPLVAGANNDPTAMELFSPFPAGLIAKTIAGMTLLVITGAIPLFFLLPRATHIMNPQPSGQTQLVSGFSESVRLGRAGVIKQSDSIVMRVRTSRTPEEFPAPPRWRGIAFDHFDGMAWKRGDVALHEIPLQGLFYKLEDEAQGTNWISQTFFIEVLSTNVVFTLARPLAVSRDIGNLQRDASDSLYTSDRQRKKLSYTAISDPVHPDPAIISDHWAIPDEILEKYLQLPALDPGIQAMVEKITAPVSGRYAKAREIERYLRSHYEYSLDLKAVPGGKDPLAAFLFETKAGHCEYFATAMAIMLRRTGIPARLVNGFSSGTYNRISRNWTVRQRDAHSWVEAYLPPYGWITFDPTPAEPYGGGTAFETMVSDLSDAFMLWWWDGIVNYDAIRQYRVVGSLRDRTVEITETIASLLSFTGDNHRSLSASIVSRFHDSKWSESLVLILLLLAPAALFSIRPFRARFLRGAQRLFHRRNQRAVAISFYEEALELLAAHGYRRGMDQTPLEFAESLAGRPAGAPFMTLTRLYNAARFGHSPSGLKHSASRALLAALRDSLKSRT